jgi:RNA polymerase sigma factor (sigma-70 family)
MKPHFARFLALLLACVLVESSVRADVQRIVPGLSPSPAHFSSLFAAQALAERPMANGGDSLISVVRLENKIPKAVTRRPRRKSTGVSDPALVQALSDEEAWDGIKIGDEQVLLKIREIISTVTSRRFGLSFSERQDVIQETWLKAWRFFSGGSARNPEALLKVMGKRKMIDELRRNKTRDKTIGTSIHEIPDNSLILVNPAESPFELLLRARKEDLAGAAMNALRLQSKLAHEVYYLWHVEGHKFAEIAKLLDISVGTVKSRMYTAQIFLRSYLIDNVPRLAKKAA